MGAVFDGDQARLEDVQICVRARGFDRAALASRNAIPSRKGVAMLVHASKAVKISSMMCPAHIATRRDATRRGGLGADQLGGMCQEALEDCSAKARPDQPPHDVLVGGAELVEVRVRLPLLENQLDLPAEPIEPRDEVQRERRARKVGAQTGHRLLATGHPDDAKPNAALAALVLHIEAHPPPCVLRDEARQADRLRQRNALAIDPGSADPWIVAPGQPHDEHPAVFTHGLEVGHVWIAAVGEEQAVAED